MAIPENRLSADAKFDEALKKVRLILTDVDGVMTDGNVYLFGDIRSTSTKSLHSRRYLLMLS